MASWDQANRGERLGLVWRNRKKISQIINDYFCLPFFLLIILWLAVTGFFVAGNWGSVSSAAKDLVKQMLDVEPARRITTSQVQGVVYWL
jgi:hypothetical protein